MNKIIFVTTTKPFNSVFSFRQINAITSWCKLENIEKEIYVFTEDKINEHFDEDTLKYINTINEFEKSNYTEIPTYRSLWNFGIKRAKEVNGYVCQVNADIILTKSFVDTINAIIEQVDKESFGIIGQRTDWRTPKAIDFSNKDWESLLILEEKKNFELHPGCGIDFIFGNEHTLPELPIFYVARLHYDRWLTGQLIGKNDFSIDITRTAMAIHQDHGYGNDGNWSINEHIANYNTEFKINQRPEMRQVRDTIHTKYTTILENDKIILKNR